MWLYLIHLADDDDDDDAHKDTAKRLGLKPELWDSLIGDDSKCVAFEHRLAAARPRKSLQKVKIKTAP